MRRPRHCAPDGLARALRAAGSLDLADFHVDFSKSNHSSRFVDIGLVNGEGRFVC